MIAWINTCKNAPGAEGVYAQPASANEELGEVNAATDDGFCLPVRAKNGKITIHYL